MLHRFISLIENNVFKGITMDRQIPLLLCYVILFTHCGCGSQASESDLPHPPRSAAPSPIQSHQKLSTRPAGKTYELPVVAVAPAARERPDEIVKLTVTQARRANLSDFVGKTIEVTDVIEGFAEDPSGYSIWLQSRTEPFICHLPEGETEPWAYLTLGRNITLRGNVSADRTAWTWRIVTSKPGLAPILTATSIAERAEKDPRTARLDFDWQYLIVKGTIDSMKSDEAGTFTLRGSDSCQILCTTDSRFKAKMEKYKPGDSIQLFGMCIGVTWDEKESTLHVQNIIPITTALPVPGIVYSENIETHDARTKRGAIFVHNEKAASSVTADKLLQDYEAYPIPKFGPLFSMKYEMKRIEVTGKIASFGESPDRGYDLVHFDTDFICTLLDRDPWNSIAPGQTVVVRGYLNSGWAEVRELDLFDSVIVRVDPKSPQVSEFDAKTLADNFLKNPAKFHRDNHEKWIVVSGKLQEVKPTVLEAGGVKIKCEFDIPDYSRHLKRFMKHQPGDTVRILGKLSSFDADKLSITLTGCWERR